MWSRARQFSRTIKTQTSPKAISIPACTRRREKIVRPHSRWQISSLRKRAQTLVPGAVWRARCWETSRPTATGRCMCWQESCLTSLSHAGSTTGSLFLSTCGLLTAARPSKQASIRLSHPFSPRMLLWGGTTETVMRSLCRWMSKRRRRWGAMMWGGCLWRLWRRSWNKGWVCPSVCFRAAVRCKVVFVNLCKFKYLSIQLSSLAFHNLKNSKSV